MGATEATRRRGAAALAGVAGTGLALLAGLEGAAALLPALMAQPLLALAVSWGRGTRALPGGARAVLHDGGHLLAAWALGLLRAAAVLAWPVQALRQAGTLGAALGASAMAAAVLLALWRTWPAWRALERESTSFRNARSSGSGTVVTFSTMFTGKHHFMLRWAPGGRELSGSTIGDALGGGIFLIPESRKEQGLVLQRSIRENVTLANLAGSAALGWWAIDEVARGVNPWRRILGASGVVFVAYRLITAF